MYQLFVVILFKNVRSFHEYYLLNMKTKYFQLIYHLSIAFVLREVSIVLSNEN